MSREVWQAVQDKIRDAREYNPTAHRIVKPSVFSGKIICGKCGQNYTKGQARISKADGLKEIWVCFGKIKHGKVFCDSLSLRGDRLREAAAKAMGIEEFDDRAFTERVDKIMTTEGGALVFRFYDGTEKEVPIKLYRQNHMATDDPHMKEVKAAGFASFRGKVSHRFITRMLDDERYIGRRTLAARYSGTGKDEVIENDHEAIIDPELFAKVRELREISWKKQARRLATNKAKREAEHGKNGNSTAADD